MDDTTIDDIVEYFGKHNIEVERYGNRFRLIDTEDHTLSFNNFIELKFFFKGFSQAERAHYET